MDVPLFQGTSYYNEPYLYGEHDSEDDFLVTSDLSFEFFNIVLQNFKTNKGNSLESFEENYEVENEKLVKTNKLNEPNNFAKST